MMWDGHDGMGWWMLWSSIFWIILIVTVGLVVARLVDGTRSSGSSTAGSAQVLRETPLEIARRRYASGELSKDEFEQIRRDLS